MAKFKNYPVRPLRDLREMVHTSAELFGDATAFMQKENGEYVSYSFRRYCEDVDSLGCMLIFSAGLWVDVFACTIPLQYYFPELSFGSMEYYRRGTHDDPYNPLELTVGEMQFRQPYTEGAALWSGNSLRSGYAGVDTQTLAENPYEYPDAQLLKMPNGDVLFAREEPYP